MLIIGEEYTREEISKKYGGQIQRGIVTPKDKPFIILFSTPKGEQYGYSDGWHDGIFYYTGEGQTGDQKIEKGNKAIAESEGKKDILLLELSKGTGNGRGRNKYRFTGIMQCIGYHEDTLPDRNKNNRSVIVFELISIQETDNLRSSDPEKTQENITLEDLEEKIESLLSSNPTTTKDRKVRFYERNKYIRMYALKEANGVCQNCKKEASFNDKLGNPYLEVHHINRLSDGGFDNINNVVALCPNCHREIHHGSNGEKINKNLKETIRERSI